jgi:hypothetical protein
MGILPSVLNFVQNCGVREIEQNARPVRRGIEMNKKSARTFS